MPGCTLSPARNTREKIICRAAGDTIERGFTHYITDVFEGEPHSPFKFHSRVMGFQVVATHETGELNCPCRRITMLLDLRQTYLRLRLTNNWMFRTTTRGWEAHLHQQMLGEASSGHTSLPAMAAS